jgi:hypothetical protein
VFERACIVVLAVVLTLLFAVSVAGHGPLAGQVLYTISPTHGVDEGDVPMAIAWALGMGCLLGLWRRL